MPTPGTIEYPAALDTAVSYGEVANNASTTIGGTILPGSLLIPISDPNKFPNSGIATLIDSITPWVTPPTKMELVLFESKNGSSLVIPTGGRGVFGTTPLDWSAGEFIEIRPLAQHLQALSQSDRALQAKVGFGDSAPAAGKLLRGTGAGSSAWLDASYHHHQAVVATVWSITHNLNSYPSVSVTDGSGQEAIAEVVYLSANALTISFSQAQSGDAYLN